MPVRNFASISLAAAIMLSGMAPVLANELARQPATHSTRSETRKAEPAQITKDKDSQERARTALLNSSQMKPEQSQPDRGTVVSVGLQVRAFERVRDIAMAPTG